MAHNIFKKVNDYETIEIIVEPIRENGEYVYSNLYVAHDHGREKEFIMKFNQANELMNSNIGEILVNYINDHI